MTARRIHIGMACALMMAVAPVALPAPATAAGAVHLAQAATGSAMPTAPSAETPAPSGPAAQPQTSAPDAAVPVSPRREGECGRRKMPMS